MRKTSKGSKASVKAEQPVGESPDRSAPCGRRPAVDHFLLTTSCFCPAGEGGDVKGKALNEMMERIKHGVVLRKVKSQESKVMKDASSSSSSSFL